MEIMCRVSSQKIRASGLVSLRLEKDTRGVKKTRQLEKPEFRGT